MRPPVRAPAKGGKGREKRAGLKTGHYNGLRAGVWAWPVFVWGDGGIYGRGRGGFCWWWRSRRARRRATCTNWRRCGRGASVREGEEFLGLGHVFFTVGYGPAFFYAEVVYGEDVGAAETEDQEHFDRPGADAADGDEAFDELFVGEFLGLFERGTMPSMVFCARSFMATIFAPERPALRRTGFRSLSISCGVGARPVALRALTRPKIVAAAFPEMD